MTEQDIRDFALTPTYTTRDYQSMRAKRAWAVRKAREEADKNDHLQNKKGSKSKLEQDSQPLATIKVTVEIQLSPS